jgi:hypothetical protein
MDVFGGDGKSPEMIGFGREGVFQVEKSVSGRLELLLDQKRPFLFLDGVLKFFWSSPHDRGLSRRERSLLFGTKDAI